MADRQAEVAAFLSEPASHGGAAVEVVDTHAARVFLAGQTAYKMKRALRYAYLDFTDLDTRRAMLGRELALNGPAAPQIYGKVIPVTDGPEGLRLGGDGPAVEWVLRMARFDRDNELSRLAERGALDIHLAVELGRAVAALHLRAPPRGAPGDELISEIVAELTEAFDGMRDALGPAASDAFGRALGEATEAQRAMLAHRGRAGRVRRCHGDLHLRNIVLIGGHPVPFDALEFDERLGTCDVLYDLAFLLMDMRHRGLREAATATLAAWSAALDGADDEGLSALPLFLALRGAIRAMVLVQTDRASDRPQGALPEARAYLAAARADLASAPVRLVAIGGRSGTGKTTLARRIAADLWSGAGALHLGSDLERKAMLKAPPFDPLPDAAYSAAMSARLYARLFSRARTTLGAGAAVVIDATFLDADRRAEVLALAREAGVPFDGLWLDAPAEELQRRVAARHGDVSDADTDVLARQAAPADPGPGWRRVDANGPPHVVADRISATLGVAPE